MNYKIILDGETLRCLRQAVEHAVRVDEDPSAMELEFATREWDEQKRVSRIPMERKDLREAIRQGCLLSITMEARGGAAVSSPHRAYRLGLSWRDFHGVMWTYWSTHSIKGANSKEIEKALRGRLRMLSIRGPSVQALLTEGMEQVFERQLEKDSLLEKKQIVEWFRGGGLASPPVTEQRPEYRERDVA